MTLIVPATEIEARDVDNLMPWRPSMEQYTAGTNDDGEVEVHAVRVRAFGPRAIVPLPGNWERT